MPKSALFGQVHVSLTLRRDPARLTGADLRATAPHPRCASFDLTAGPSTTGLAGSAALRSAFCPRLMLFRFHSSARVLVQRAGSLLAHLRHGHQGH